MAFTIACTLLDLCYRVDLHCGLNDYIGATRYKTYKAAMKAGLRTGATFLEGQ